MKPKNDCKFDWIGTCLCYALPVITFCTLGFSLFPLVMPPEYNYVHCFVIDVFNFNSEKTEFWLLFRIFHSIVVCVEAFISIGTFFLHVTMAVLVIYLDNSWLTHLERITSSMRSINKFLDFYNVLRVFNTLCQSIASFLAPLQVVFSFIVSIICNVTVLTMFHNMDTLTYIFCFCCGSIFLSVTVIVLQFASQLVEHSTSCFKKCDNVIFGRKAKRTQKKLKSLQIIGFKMGTFYLISMDMVLIYGYHMLDKTISALLVS